MKKVLSRVFMFTVVVSSLVFCAPAHIYAQPGGGSTTPSPGGNVKCEDINKDGNPDDNIQKFLAFPAWYRGLECNSSSNSIELSDHTEVGTVILTVSLNIIDIVLRLIGIMAVGFVIYGGFQYVISRGEPEHTKAALYVLLFRHCEPS